MSDRNYSKTHDQARLVTETAALRKVRGEMAINAECLWARYKDTTHDEAERALAFGQYDNATHWLAALDAILGKRDA